MPLNSVNTNTGAMIALQSLNATTSELSVTQSRINTGRKINDAKDNAAIWAIAQNQRAELNSFGAVKDSLSRGQSAIDVALSGGEAISDTLNKMKQLALNASDKNLDQNSRKAMETEYNSLAKQINSTIQNASFNGVNMLDGNTVAYKALANTKGTSTIDVYGENFSVRTAAATAGTAYKSGVDLQNGFTVAAGTTSQIQIDTDIGGETAVTVSFAEGTYTADQVVTQINTALQKAGGNQAKVVAELVPGTGAGNENQRFVRLSTGFTGSTSHIAVTQVAGTPTPAYPLSVSAAQAATNTGTNATGGGGILDIAASVTFTKDTNFLALLDQLDRSITNVSSSLGRLGSGSKAMEASMNFVSKLQDTLESGIGSLVDADLAKESARLQALQTKQQLGVQALSIANQSTGVLLGLFR